MSSFSSRAYTAAGVAVTPRAPQSNAAAARVDGWFSTPRTPPPCSNCHRPRAGPLTWRRLPAGPAGAGSAPGCCRARAWCTRSRRHAGAGRRCSVSACGPLAWSSCGLPEQSRFCGQVLDRHFQPRALLVRLHAFQQRPSDLLVVHPGDAIQGVGEHLFAVAEIDALHGVVPGVRILARALRPVLRPVREQLDVQHHAARRRHADARGLGQVADHRLVSLRFLGHVGDRERLRLLRDHAHGPVAVRADRVREGQVDHRAASCRRSRERVTLRAASSSIFMTSHMRFCPWMPLKLPWWQSLHRATVVKCWP
uniref:Cyclic nucleotide-binding domain-containing protein n=1 Tax=Heterorhabditis bacteriophora TaxID=37862 RepID=A0A1I7WCY1_HETBA